MEKKITGLKPPPHLFLWLECPWISTRLEAATWHVVELVDGLLHMHNAPNLLPNTG